MKTIIFLFLSEALIFTLLRPLSIAIKNTLETIQIYYKIRCYTDTVDEQIIRDIRKCSMKGRPCGDDRFMKKLERLFGRRLRALPWGRPRKN